MLRHEREREARVRSREQRLFAQLLACQVSPVSGGTDMQTSATPYTLQRWQALGTSCAVVRKEMENESGDQTKPQDQQWVAVSANRKLVSCEKENKENKNAKTKKAKNVFDEEDGILLIVPIRIYGKVFGALVDSEASRCFISPEVLQTAQLQWEPHDIFLKLGNGERVLSRGRVMNVPIVTGNHCTRCNLTVTSFLHQVNLVLGVSWLKQMNPLIDWNAGATYWFSNGFPQSFLYGQWLESACKIGTVSIIYSSDQLEALKRPEIQKQISVIQNACFWEYGSVKSANSWASFAAQGTKCTVQLKTNENDPENQV